MFIAGPAPVWKLALALAVLGLSAIPAHAQQSPEARPPATPVTPSPFRLERFAEDWRAMADEANRSRPWHRLKWIDLGEATLTLGGDLRLRGERIDAPLFGATGAKADSYLLQRAMLHADLRVGPSVRGFVQLSHHRGHGRRQPFPLDRDGLDLQQAFVELTHADASGAVGLRYGRQEIILSPRFVNPREAVNIRSAYDGVRAWAVRGPWRAEGFYSRPVQNRAGSFDNRGNPAERFDGVRLSRGLGPAGAWRVTASWYGQQREEHRIGALGGSDDRSSWGLRLTGRHRKWDIDAEHYHQTGRFAGRRIRAFGGGGEAGYALGGPARARIGLRWLYGSGDGDPGDDVAGTFAGPFPRPPCCIDPLWLAPSNLAAVTPLVQVAPHPKVAVEAKVDVLHRLRRSDAVYAFPQIAYPASRGLPGSFLGAAPGISVSWTPVEEATVSLQHVEQGAEGALEAAGGRDGRFTVASIALRF